MSMASRADVYVCSFFSAANKNGIRFINRMLGTQGKKKLVVVIDEAQFSPCDSLLKILDKVTKLCPNRILLGLTATPSRMSKTSLKKLREMYNVDNNIRNHIGTPNGYIYEVTAKELIKTGFLAKPILEYVETNINAEVEYDITPEDEAYFIKNKDLHEHVLSQIADFPARNKIIVDRYLKNKERYGKTLIFAININHAKTLKKEFDENGISCEYVVSGMKDKNQIIEDFRNNKFNVLINVQILTAGTDIPDIQTIFAARETNSDVLLTQMIGRALRGPKANGTETAYIVSFHDIWERFQYGIDPGSIDIFDEDYVSIKADEYEEIEEVYELPEEPRGWDQWPPVNNMKTTEVEDGIDYEAFFMKLYDVMKIQWTTTDRVASVPIGWFAVPYNNESKQIFVYDIQVEAYDKVAANVNEVIEKKYDAGKIAKKYFTNVDEIPTFEDLDALVKYIETNGDMPELYTFEDRELFNTKTIAEEMVKQFSKEEDQEYWLKTLFDETPILQNIYKYFAAFKKTIFDELVEKKNAVIETIDDRQKYDIEENVYDLNELMDEVVDRYRFLKKDAIASIEWTKKPVTKWCAVTWQDRRSEIPRFKIFVSSLYSSKRISRETIKFLIYHELIHANGWWEHDDDFYKIERMFDNSADCDGELDEIALKYNLDKNLKYAVPNISEKEIFPEYYEPINHKPFEFDYSKAPQKNNCIENNSSESKGIKTGVKYCRECGKKLPEDAKFCDRCGANVQYN
jgi:type I site-specific restriction endonuclease